MWDSMTKVKNLTRRLKIVPPRRSSAKSSTSSASLYPCYISYSSPSPTSKGKTNFDDVFTTSPKRRLSSTKSVPLSPLSKNDVRDCNHFGELQIKLDEINAELLSMKRADEELASKFLALYKEIHKLKVCDSYVKNGELLDEAIHEIEQASNSPRITDEPRQALNKVLQQRGITRMNLWIRRFSCS